MWEKKGLVLPKILTRLQFGVWNWKLYKAQTVEHLNVPIEANPQRCAISIVNVAFDVKIQTSNTFAKRNVYCIRSVWTRDMLSKTDLTYIKFWTNENSFEKCLV
jgi:hypothetical protein